MALICPKNSDYLASNTFNECCRRIIFLYITGYIYLKIE